MFVDAALGERWTSRWNPRIVFTRKHWMLVGHVFGWNHQEPSLARQMWEDVLVVIVAELWLILREINKRTLDVRGAGHLLMNSVEKLPPPRLVYTSIPRKWKEFLSARKNITSDKTSVSTKADSRASVVMIALRPRCSLSVECYAPLIISRRDASYFTLLLLCLSLACILWINIVRLKIVFKPVNTNRSNLCISRIGL